MRSFSPGQDVEKDGCANQEPQEQKAPLPFSFDDQKGKLAQWQRDDGKDAANSLPVQADEAKQESVHGCDRLGDGIGGKDKQPEFNGEQAPDTGRPAEEVDGQG